MNQQVTNYIERYKHVGISRDNNRTSFIRFRGYWLTDESEDRWYKCGLDSTLDNYRGELD